MTAISYGYLTTPYLMGPYLGGYIDEITGSQVDMKITSGLRTIGEQIDQKIFSENDIGEQVNQIIYALFNLGSQVDMEKLESKILGEQVDQKIFDDMAIGIQSLLKVYYERQIASQVLQKIEDEEKRLGSQINNQIISGKIFGNEVRFAPLQHLIWERYLTNPYLTDGYLAAGFHALQSSQVSLKLYHPKITGEQVRLVVSDFTNSIGEQVSQKIYQEFDLGEQVSQKLYHPKILGEQVDLEIASSNKIGEQVLLKIYDENNVGTQARLIRISSLGDEVTLVIYNITQLRILENMVSRGTPALGGANWTSDVALRTGDFGTENLNTDILEQRCETESVPAQWILTCNTGIPQGAFVDTLAILEHNLTKSARIEFQGSDDPLFGTVGFSTVLTSELKNTYWISPSLPNEGFIYWRLLIDDITNTEDGLFIGAIVFGSASIMTVSETFENPATFGWSHYKDASDTEGYRKVSNDRALRKRLSLAFSNLKYDGGNFEMLRDYWLSAKTDIACLIIPRPTKPSALAVFSKLTNLPSEEHNAISDDDHYVSFTLDWDESL